MGGVGDVTGLRLSGDHGTSGRTDHVDITIIGSNGTVTTKGDSFMAIVNSGLTDEGRGLTEQILSTKYFFPNFALTDKRIHQDYANFLPPGWIGAETNDKFGTSFTQGDFNGDQSKDIVIGAPGESIGGITSAGIIHAIYGGTGGIDNNSAFYQGEGGWPGVPESGDGFGSAVAAGDFNGDGFDDLIVGSPGESVNGLENAGIITISYGTANGLETAEILHQRDELSEHLNQENIGNGVYYPIPVHQLPSFDKKIDLPNTRTAAEQALSIPVHPLLTREELHRIVEVINTWR